MARGKQKKRRKQSVIIRELLLACLFVVVCVPFTIGFGQMLGAAGGKVLDYYRAGRGEHGVAGSAEVTRTEVKGGNKNDYIQCFGTFTPDDGGFARTGLRIHAADCTRADLDDVRLVAGDTSGRIAVDDPDVIIARGDAPWLTEAALALIPLALTLVCGALSLGAPFVVYGLVLEALRDPRAEE
ncbi:hypothetical protein [Streptomyces chumphonensis]|uniref:hypothetical protein n=1 Tax=Streptomyces chumphonensis TaxID=1214925 RepID=UPI003D71E0E1